MTPSDAEILQTAIQSKWSGKPSAKAGRYIGLFFNPVRLGRKITAQVEGNHGTYTVSIQVDERGVSSACSCYIGEGGYCHHCEALAFTFLKDGSVFREIKSMRLDNVQDLQEMRASLQSTTLESLLKQLGEKGITQKAFAESIGMNARHLSAIKSSELRNRYFNELGVTKLACLWVLDHIQKIKA